MERNNNRRLQWSTLSMVAYPCFRLAHNVFLQCSVHTFFVIVNNKETRAIMNYYRKRGNSVVCSFLKVFKTISSFSMMFDRLAVMNGDDNFNIEIINNEVFEQHINNEKGFMLCHSHVGNSELTGFLLHQNKKTINSVISVTKILK